MLFRLAVLSLLCSLPTAAGAQALEWVHDFGDNPGEVRMFRYVPEGLLAGAPLVVALHGCGQDAAEYARTGWLPLADRWRFAVAFPEQTRANNPLGCWNWFRSEDAARDRGEARSIAAVVERMKADHRVDGTRVFLEGLSAGGWMAAALLAAYPDLFAGGATFGGGPAFCATVKRRPWDWFGFWAFWEASWSSGRCMRGRDREPEAWEEAVRERTASPPGRWPRLSIWQGSRDETVDPVNLRELLEQWTALHDVDREPDRIEEDPHFLRREYWDGGEPRVETYLLPDLGHGIPVDPPSGCGEASEHLLPSGVCGVARVARFWGLVPAE